MSRFISADTATTASHAFRPSSSIHELSTYPAPSCSRFQGRRGSKEWTVATSLDPYVRFARAPAKFVYHVCVWTMSESIGSATMFMLKLRTSNVFATFGSGTPWGFKVGRYRRTAIPALSGGGPSSRVRTSTSMSFERDLAMYFAWTPAPPYTFGGNSHVKIVVFIARRGTSRSYNEGSGKTSCRGPWTIARRTGTKRLRRRKPPARTCSDPVESAPIP